MIITNNLHLSIIPVCPVEVVALSLDKINVRARDSARCVRDTHDLMIIPSDGAVPAVSDAHVQVAGEERLKVTVQRLKILFKQSSS